jgi:hypothetical protein
MRVTRDARIWRANNDVVARCDAEDLERGLAIIRDGHEMMPAWRIFTPD